MENASTILTTAIPANDNPGTNHDPNKREPPTGINILLVIIYGGMVGIMCVLFVQRLLLRIAPKYSKGYTDVTKHAPKRLKEDIQKRLMQTMNIYFDPTLLLSDDHRHSSLLTKEASTPYNYLYRMKVLDQIKSLEESLNKHDQTLKRPTHKDLAQHFRDIKSNGPSILKNVRSTQLKMLADCYKHARYKQEAFGIEHYDRFSEVFAEVMAAIDQKSKKKRSGKKISARKNTNSSNNATTVYKPSGTSKHIDTEPLIMGSSSSQS